MSDPTVWLAAGYGIFLLVVAHGLDRMARRTAARTSAWRSGAFTYHADHDAWLCPQDQWLWPQSFDPDNRVMRYRASPTVCNACPVKDTCTTSATGREITRNIDPWPASESERFHRGIACTVAALGALWPLGMLFTEGGWAERGVLAAALAVVVLGSWPLWSHLRRSPARFPDHVPVKDLDDAVAADAVAVARDARRRSGYRSERRPVPVEITTAPAAPAAPAERSADGQVDDQADHDRFATRWGAFAASGEPPDAGWSRRRPS